MDYNPYSKNFKEEIIGMNEDETPEDKALWSDIVYKNELAAAFLCSKNKEPLDPAKATADLDPHFDDTLLVEKINVLFDELYERKELNPHIQPFFDIIQNGNQILLPMVYNPFFSSRAQNDEKEMLKLNFQTMFSYPLFHITHLCIADLYKYGAVQEENMGYLRNIVQSELFSL
jgi:hypothetical protein